MNLQVREAVESDNLAIANVVIAAFGDEQGPEIAELIAALLADPTAQPLRSLVATINDRVVGHVLFTHTHIEPSPRNISSAILAPLAVHPDHQNQGIGSRLIQQGLERLRAAGVELVFVLGYPGYYSRHGFTPAGVLGLDAPHPIPPEHADAWMVQALHAGVIGSVKGQVVCAATLNDPKHWRE